MSKASTGGAMVEISQVQWRGADAIALEDDCLRCVVIPSLGGKMPSLILKATGSELYWQDPDFVTGIPEYGIVLPEEITGGYQECFPTISEIAYPEHPWGGVIVPDHGEVWALPWDFFTTEDGLHLWVYSVRFGYRLDKWIALAGDGRLDFRYELTSLTPFDFRCFWSSHPALNFREGMRMLLPDGTRAFVDFSLNGRLGEVGTAHDWPISRDSDGREVDLSVIHGIETGGLEKLYAVGMTDGWCAGYWPDSGEYVGYTFSLDEIPYVGIWIMEGGWYLNGVPHMVGGFEPCTGYPDDLLRAMAGNTCMTLPGRGKLEWTLHVHVGVEPELNRLLEMLSEAGP